MKHVTVLKKTSELETNESYIQFNSVILQVILINLTAKNKGTSGKRNMKQKMEKMCI